MYKIFALGNSLTADTTRFFAELSEHEEGYAKVVSLLIGGMSLEGHTERLIKASADYDLFINGVGSRFKTSIPVAVPTDEWSHILIQEAYGAYTPTEELRRCYETLGAYFRCVAPKAKILLLNTWCWQEGAPEGIADRKEMKARLWEMAEFGADCLGISKSDIVPVGRVVDTVADAGIKNLYRDNIHLSLSVGRYLAAETLYSWLSRKSAVSAFRGFTSPRIEEDFLFGTIHDQHFAPTDEKELLEAQNIIERTLSDLAALEK